MKVIEIKTGQIFDAIPYKNGYKIEKIFYQDLFDIQKKFYRITESQEFILINGQPLDIIYWYYYVFDRRKELITFLKNSFVTIEDEYNGWMLDQNFTTDIL